MLVEGLSLRAVLGADILENGEEESSTSAMMMMSDDVELFHKLETSDTADRTYQEGATVS